MQGVHKDPVIGRMHLKLKYDFKRSDLVVTLLQGKSTKNVPLFCIKWNLISFHILVREVSSSITECYLKVYLSDEPSTGKVKQTKFVRRHLMHFEFHEEFKFPITFDELSDRMLMVQFYEHNASAKSSKSNVLLGVISLDLQRVDPSADIEIIADIEPTKNEVRSFLDRDKVHCDSNSSLHVLQLTLISYSTNTTTLQPSQMQQQF